jgi:Flp pilus assembly protein TadG
LKILRRNKGGKGQALVEFAFVVVLLLTLTFGVIDFGWLIKDLLLIHQAAREGARIAAIGGTTGEITATVLASGAAASLTSGDVHLYKAPAGSTSWGTLGNNVDGTQNNALPGERIRVSVSTQHHWITGFFLASSPIDAAMIMRRE